jgi:hypothetical protein
MAEAMNQLRTKLDETGGRTALVAGATPPPRPPETVTVAPGTTASLGPDGRCAPLFVTAEAASGRTIRRYDGRDADAAADCAARLVAERDPRAVWLCHRAQIKSWWGDGVVALLERRLDEAAREAEARLVVWSRENDVSGDESNSDESSKDESSEGDVAVGDRYDVVVAP